MKLLFLDTETGGIDPQKHSLLSIGMMVWENGFFCARKLINVNDGVNVCTKEALSINKINIDEHIKNGISPKEAINEMIDFIETEFGKGERVILCGHNIGFDIRFLKQMFKNNNCEYGKYFSHRSVDTHSIMLYLQICGVIREKVTSSHDALKYFGIKPVDRHNALGDAIDTAILFDKLVEEVRHNDNYTFEEN